MLSEDGRSTLELDAIVIGAGFAGIRALYEMRRLGLAVRLLEAGGDLGGTWFWNRYPGARSDSQAWTYCYSFDPDLGQEWDWRCSLSTQKDIEAYLHYVVDKLDLRQYMQFGTRVSTARFDSDAHRWTVGTETGEHLGATYLITGVGILSEPVMPSFPGVESFQGERHLTARWPSESVSFAGKRVGIVGTGASAAQLIPIAAQAATRVMVFQRTPTYVLPARNQPIDPETGDAIKRNYDSIWHRAHDHAYGLALDPPGRTSKDVTAEECERIFERGWEAGGFTFICGCFDDLSYNAECNELACEFIRKKIRAIVKDPAVAELLCPTHPFYAKPPPLGSQYYETYNRSNVSLVDIGSNAISEVTPTGMRLEDGTHHPLDMIVFALGFDAITGALTAIDCRGTHGQTLKETWQAHGTRTAYGMCLDGFPNLFAICGPQTPFGNMPVIIEQHVAWMGQLIDHARKNGSNWIEAKPDTVASWKSQTEMLLNWPGNSVQAGAKFNSWFVGANVEGKPRDAFIYFGGVNNFLTQLNAEAARGFPGFDLVPGRRHSPSAAV